MKDCAQKARYRTREQAARDLARLTEDKARRGAVDAQPLVAYRCHAHRCWHVGHATRETRERFKLGEFSGAGET